MENNHDEVSLKVEGYPLIAGYVGIFITFIGFFCFLPLILLVWYPEESVYAKSFIVPGVVFILVGYMLSGFIRGKELGNLQRHQDAVLVLLVWVSTILICSMPFILTGEYSFMQSVFESTSGFSTTGLSVVDVSSAPHMILMYRSLMLFIGGVGLVLVFTSVMSDRYGMRLYSAEGHSDKLLPNLAKSTRLILSIYGLYICLGTAMYVIFGMSFFDAINHSIAAVSTGGFSTQASSIASYQSASIEIVTIVLMILGGTNFFVHLYLLRGHIRKLVKHSEIKLLLFITLLICPWMIISLTQAGYSSVDAIRHGVFQYFSAITTTGFQTLPSFQSTPRIFTILMILLMLIGAEIGSTGGGIKQQRVLLFFKGISWNFRDKMSHKRQLHTNLIDKTGERVIISDKEIFDNFSFIGFYLLLFLVGSFIFVMEGNSLQDSMFEFASALGTVGLSVGITGYHASNVILITSTVGMFLGRLEIYVVLIGISKIKKDVFGKGVLR
jgi:trk system potassium uptake protein